MKEMMKKEYLFGLRNSKFLIISMVYMFFALSVPVMVKVLLPAVLRSQFPGMSEVDLAMMIDISQYGSLTNYLQNIFEVGMIIVVFTLSGLIAAEIKDNTLVQPICSGRQFSHILLSKFVVNAILLLVVTFIALVTTYYYSGILFGQEVLFKAVLKTAVLESLFSIFIITLILVFGVFIKRPIPTGLASIGFVYILSFAGSLFNINKYLPTGLHAEANLFESTVSTDTLITIIVTILAIALLLFTTIKKLQQAEWNIR